MAVDAVEALLALLRRHREVDDAAAALAGHPRHERVVGVEHGRAGARHRVDEHALDVRQLAPSCRCRAGRGGRRSRWSPPRRRCGRSRGPRAGCRRAPPRTPPCPPTGSAGPSAPSLGPHMSPFRISRPSMTMPSVVVMPTRRPISFRMWAIIRTVVVLPLVPVTPMIGMRALAPGGKSRSMTGLATYCGSPSVGWVCMRKPGRGVDLDDRAALLAHRDGDVGHDEVDAGDIEADHLGRRLGDLDVVGVGLDGCGRSRCRRSTCCRSRRAGRACPSGGTSSSAEALLRDQLLGAAASTLMRVSTFSWPMPRRGSAFSISTSCAHGVLAVADDARRDALGDRDHPAADDEHAVVVARDVRLDHDVAAAALVACAIGNALRTSSSERRSRPDAAAVVAVQRLDHDRDSRSRRRRRPRRRPCAPTPSAARAARPSCSSWLVRLLSEAMSTAIAAVREVIVARMRCWWTPWPSCTRLCRSSRIQGMSRETASSMIACVDGPNARRSASRISRSSSSAKSRSAPVVGRDEVVDQRDGDAAGLAGRPPPRGTRR